MQSFYKILDSLDITFTSSQKKQQEQQKEQQQQQELQQQQQQQQQQLSLLVVRFRPAYCANKYNQSNCRII